MKNLKITSLLLAVLVCTFAFFSPPDANGQAKKKITYLELTDIGIGARSTTSVAVDEQKGILHKTTITITDLAQAVVNGTEYQGTKIYDFPEGRILILGTTATLQQTTTSAITSTLNGATAAGGAGAVGAVSLGTATASNVALTSTMVDLLPSTAFNSSLVINTAGTAVSSALASSAQFDGTGTAIDMYLNSAYATTTDVDANATQTWNGTVVIPWINLGDY